MGSTVDETPMRIVGLKFENFKRIEVVEIIPDGDVIELRGKNGAGKTSILDGIEAAFGGAEAFGEMPIRKGQKKAVMELDLGDLKIRRVIEKDKAPKFELVDSGGGTLKSPQAVLNSLYSKSAADPVEFARMKPKEQQVVVAKISGVDPEAFASKRQTLMTKRADVNRLAKSTQAVVDQKKAELDQALKSAGLKAPPAEIESIEKLMADLNAGEKVNEAKAMLDRASKSAAAEVVKHSNLIMSAADEIQGLEKKLADLKANHARLVATEQEYQITERKAFEEWKAAPQFDPAPIQDKILKADGLNKCHRLNADLIKTMDQLTETEKIADDYTKKIERHDAEFKAAVAAAKMPVEGLGFSEVGVTFNGVPFEEASSAEQLRISAAIAMSGSPRIRVCIVRDASLLDEDSLKLLAQVAKERQYQLWVEQVGTGETGILIVDGHVEERPVDKVSAE